MSGFDPYQAWLDIPREQRPVSHYRLLGLPQGEGNPHTIAAAAARVSAHLRQFFSGEHVGDCQQLLAEVEQARVTLSDPGRRAQYDAGVSGGNAARETQLRPPPPLPGMSGPAGAPLSGAPTSPVSRSPEQRLPSPPSLPGLAPAPGLPSGGGMAGMRPEGGLSAQMPAPPPPPGAKLPSAPAPGSGLPSLPLPPPPVPAGGMSPAARSPAPATSLPAAPPPPNRPQSIGSPPPPAFQPAPSQPAYNPAPLPQHGGMPQAERPLAGAPSPGWSMPAGGSGYAPPAAPQHSYGSPPGYAPAMPTPPAPAYGFAPQQPAGMPPSGHYPMAPAQMPPGYGQPQMYPPPSAPQPGYPSYGMPGPPAPPSPYQFAAPPTPPMAAPPAPAPAQSYGGGPPAAWVPENRTGRVTKAVAVEQTPQKAEPEMPPVSTIHRRPQEEVAYPVVAIVITLGLFFLAFVAVVAFLVTRR